MIGHNHELTGFAFVATAAACTGMGPAGSLVLGGVGAWFALWPDIDHPTAEITRALWLLGKLLHWVVVSLSAAVWELCATKLDKREGHAFRTHRGLTHSVWWAIGTGAGVWALLTYQPWLAHLTVTALAELLPSHPALLIGEAAAGGCLVHIGGDGCTDYGISPFAPLWRWHGRRYPRLGLWEPLRFKVSHWVERLVIGPLCSALVAVALAVVVVGPQAVIAEVATLVRHISQGANALALNLTEEIHPS